MVHFFLYDYKFERVWMNPDIDIEKLKKTSWSTSASPYTAIISKPIGVFPACEYACADI